MSAPGDRDGGRYPFLWLCGPSGVGKSTAASALYRRLAGEGVPVAYADADQLGLCFPEPDPDGDPGDHRLKARNLAAVWEGFRAAGARCLILSGWVSDPGTVRVYADALPGADLTLCRLRVGPDELRARFLGRGWLLDTVEDSVRDAAALERAGLPGCPVDTDGLPVAEVVRRVRDAAGGWPGPVPPGPRVPLPRRPVDGGPTGQVLWVCGPPAVGKSTVAWEVFSQTAAAGTRAAYADLAQLGFCGPAPEDHALRARNLAALWASYRAAGARCLVVSGPVEDRETVRMYAEALSGADLTLCRLRAGAGVLAERVRLRGRGAGAQLPGDELRGRPEDWLRRYAARAVAAATALDRAGPGGLVVDTDAGEPAALAARIRASTGFPPGPGRAGTD